MSAWSRTAGAGVLLLSAAAAHAQTSPSFDLRWHRISAGGATFMSSTGYRLGGTIAQHEAGTSQSGSYRLVGGFWPMPGPDGPTPILATVVEARVAGGEVTIVWQATMGRGASAAVERRTAEDWRKVGEVGFDGEGRGVFTDRDVAPGRVRYRLAMPGSNGPIHVAEIVVDVPRLQLAIAPFPARAGSDGWTLEVTLASSGPAVAELIDPAGRRAWSRAIAAAEGAQRVVVPRDAVRPGVYVVRLAQGGRLVTRKATLVR